MLPSIRFGLNKIPRGLSCQETDEVDQTRIGCRVSRHRRLVGRIGDHVKLLGCSSRSRHNRILVCSRIAPQRDNDAR